MGTRGTEFAIRTVGVEEELLLVDPASGRPVPAVESALAALPSDEGAGRSHGGGAESHSGGLSEIDPGSGAVFSAGTAPAPGLAREAKLEQIEIVSPPCETIDDLARMVREGRRTADEVARSVGARVAALGTSVFPVSSHVTHDPRYDAIGKRFGVTMREQLTCGFHVHVAVVDEAEGVAVLDRIRPWLPVLLALSANSPFWAGEDTGFASYRYQAWGRWPSAGAYDLFESPERYRRLVSSLIASGVVLDPGMVYFDARLSARYPTIEVRVADVCMEAEHAVTIAALVRALVETSAQEWRAGVAPLPVDTAMLRAAMWSASRFGIAGSGLVDPFLGKPRRTRAAAAALLAHVAPALADAGDRERVERGVEAMLTRGGGAGRQRAVLRLTGSRRAVVMDAVEVTNRQAVPAASAA
ncbi:carboxylate-amine ligase [Leucobacter tenebrionis]|uniref:carboxylate-amine ligase n=1 Tax=Leucobacter tenebrionis TaxID=2873270 RepID=UPI001CA625EC|nr:glutamate--cysteine ligase [Leucobacter tenebrionis]QZY53251.1 glutamate--cysteine ligase [Leucobacter tenebrionis]